MKEEQDQFITNNYEIANKQLEYLNSLLTQSCDETLNIATKNHFQTQMNICIEQLRDYNQN